jgi:hypothetical protein
MFLKGQVRGSHSAAVSYPQHTKADDRDLVSAIELDSWDVLRPDHGGVGQGVAEEECEDKGENEQA